jgi:hypothetical protein
LSAASLAEGGDAGQSDFDTIRPSVYIDEQRSQSTMRNGSERGNDRMSLSTEPLFQPLGLRGLTLRNRIVMSPMTRGFSPGGIPGDDVAAYYRRRAAGETGLIITEGVGAPAAGVVWATT